jgi:hypothetical protein
MTFSRNQIVAVLLLNLGIFTFCLFNAFSWYGISDIRFMVLIVSSLVFLGFVLLVLKTHHKLVFNRKKAEL